MRTRYTTSHKRGVSKILGTLFFVGILFSVYFPMTLVMKQADNIYERKLHVTKSSLSVTCSVQVPSVTGNPVVYVGAGGT